MDKKDYLIRKARHNKENSDVLAILNLTNELSAEDLQWDKMVNSSYAHGNPAKMYMAMRSIMPNGIVFVVESHNALIGYISGFVHTDQDPRPNTFQVEHMFMKKEFRSKGIGSELLKTAIQESKNLGAISMTVMPYKANERVIKFYVKNGFNVEPFMVNLLSDF